MANITCGILIDLNETQVVEFTDADKTKGDLLPILKKHEELLLGSSATTQRGMSETLFNASTHEEVDLQRTPAEVEKQVSGIALRTLVSYNAGHAPDFTFANMPTALPKPDCIRYEWIRGDLICRYNYKLEKGPAGIEYPVHLTVAIRDHYVR